MLHQLSATTVKCCWMLYLARAAQDASVVFVDAAGSSTPQARQSSCGGVGDTRANHRLASDTRQGRPSSQGATSACPFSRLQSAAGGRVRTGRQAVAFSAGFGAQCCNTWRCGGGTELHACLPEREQGQAT